MSQSSPAETQDSGSLDDPLPPGLDPEVFRRLGYRAVDIASAHLAGMRDRDVYTPMTPEERSRLMDRPVPAAGMDPETILDTFEREILPFPMGNGHPRFFGWVNSPPAPIGVIADLLAAALDPSCAGGDHAAIYVERAAVRWLMDLVGFPAEGSMGLLVSGGSMASLTCIAAARHRAALEDGWNDREEGLQGQRPLMTLYMSSEGHTTLVKAAELLGLGSGAVRVIPSRDDLRMDVDALRARIRADREVGHRPFCVAASAGTVSTGVIDDLDALADLCTEEGLWLHVDGAYGAFGVFDDRLAARYRGLDRVDSLALDPHKWMSIPVECGCALVRHESLLRDTFSLVPPYVRTEANRGIGGLPWYSEYGFQQTRGFRALKLWMTLLHTGRDTLAAMVSRHVELAHRLAELVEASTDLELMATGDLSIVCFRYAPLTMPLAEEEIDALNKAIMEEVQSGGEAFLTQATVRGRFVLRANVLHHATTEDDLEALLGTVQRTGSRLADEIGAW